MSDKVLYVAVSNCDMLAPFLKYKVFSKLGGYFSPIGYDAVFDVLSIHLFYPVFVFAFPAVKSKSFCFPGDESKRFYYPGGESEGFGKYV